MFRKAPTPILSTSSSAPLEAMVAKQQTHIDELVAQNRTLEHTITKLHEANAEEKASSASAIAQLQERWKAERLEWRDGCESLQAAHRIAHLRTAVVLDQERTNVLKEREVLRKERLARMQRDFRLVMFQARETELEDRVAELEQLLELEMMESEEEQRRNAEAKQTLSLRMKGKADVLEARCETLTGQLQDTAEELSREVKEKEKAEEALSRLRSEHTALQASSERTSTNLERTTLLHEGLKSAHTEFEAKHAESERTVTDLRRQLEKWRNLESREDAEMDALRRSRIELEVKVKELETRAAEAETRATEIEEDVAQRDTALDKLRKKLDKHKEALQTIAAALEEAQQAAELHQNEAEEGKTLLAKTEKQIEKLKKQLEAANAEVQEAHDKAEEAQTKAEEAQARAREAQIQPQKHTSPKPPKKTKQPIRAEPAQAPERHSSHEVEQSIMASPQLSPQVSPQVVSRSRPAPRPAYKGAKAAAKPSPKPADESEDDIVEVEDPRKDKGKGKGRAKPQSKSKQDAAGAQKEKTKDKAKAKKKPTQEVDDSEVEIIEATTVDKKGKRRADVVNDNTATRKGARKRSGADDENEASHAPTQSKPKPGRSANASVGDEGESIAPKKKRRKINLFPTAQPTSFTWDDLAEGDAGLNIPTVLSPVKDSGVAPSMSNTKTGFGSFVSRR
ncbi:hypothetical protein A0H81_07920 [Grifola frondosa]|uniref:Uncharacterized protein n=1 Tax=Grifola frondosa TaxID=5627 RepID=A0A1C7M7B2_GRIFR|nr:hypothetical protein A0H81_07920 [Grifola frondosa]